MTEKSAASNNVDHPALLGGGPVRPHGPPDWPGGDPEIAEVLQQAVRDGSWGKYHGPHCEELARRLAAYHGCEHVVLCASGTAAVELALRGLKVGAGDEVVLAAYDFKGNMQNVLAVGATPVLADVEPHNWNLAVGELEAAISEKTKGILVSHLHGGVVEMPAVTEIAAAHGVPVIEDACQMPGATIDGKPAGTWGDAGILSFGGSKLLSAGRGGALFTNQAEIVQRARLYSHRGNEAYPLSELQAAVLLPQLARLDDTNAHRAATVAKLCEALSMQEGLRPFENPDSNSQPGYYKLGFQYEPAAFGGLSGDLFSRAMRAEGIAVDPGFRALHRTHSRRRYRGVGALKNASEADERVLVLHHPVLLEGEVAIAEIVAAVEKVRRHAGLIRQASEC